MYIVKHWISRIAPAVAATALVFNLSVAHALVINATTTFDNDTSLGPSFSFGPTSGSFNLISGGTSTNATYRGDIATPTNELTGPLTQNFDGTGFDGTANAIDQEFAIGFDTVISVLNDESIAKEVSFWLEYSNMVNADGPDAFADSELTLGQKFPGESVFTEIFFSDLKSDTLFGDEVRGGATGQFGDMLMESGSELFSYMLDPLEQVELKMSWTLEGGDFATGLAEANLTADLTIVPLPGALLFMLSGTLLLSLQGRMRKKISG